MGYINNRHTVVEFPPVGNVESIGDFDGDDITLIPRLTYGSSVKEKI